MTKQRIPTAQPARKLLNISLMSNWLIQAESKPTMQLPRI